MLGKKECVVTQQCTKSRWSVMLRAELEALNGTWGNINLNNRDASVFQDI